jgi:hypothetical protein
MNTQPNPNPSAAIRTIANQRGFRVGFPTDADRAALSHAIRYPNLSREQLGDRRFERVYRAAINAAVHIAGRLGYLVEPIRDHRGVLVGREFRFPSRPAAIGFKLIVDTALARRHQTPAEVMR